MGEAANTGKGYVGIDCFRVAAAALVVAVHTSPLLSLGALPDFAFAQVLARLAVPFFLAATGFFLMGRYAQAGRAGVRDACTRQSLWLFDREFHVPVPPPVGRFVKKTALLYGVCVLLYLPVNLYAGHFSGLNSLGAVLRMVFIDGTMYHLWYLPAAILGVALVWLLLRFWGLKVATAIAAGLYVLGLFGDSYYGLAAAVPGLKTLYDGVFAVASYTRNGLFYAPVFLLVGVWAAVRQGSAAGLPRAKSLVGLCFSLLALFAEGTALYLAGTQRHNSMYAALPLCVFFLLAWLGTFRGASSKTLRDVSLLVYILHPWVIVLLRGAAKAVGLEGILVENSLVHYLLVCAASFAGAGVLVWLWGRLRGGGHALPKRAWMEIDLAALGQNVAALRGLLPPGCKLMPAVKGNAYGFGAVPIAKALYRLGVRDFCVASLSEGIALRRGGVRGGILILGYTHPDGCHLVKRWRLAQTVVDYEHGLRLAQKKCGISVHIKVDTGMRRLGERSEESKRLCALFALPGLRVRGVFTQLACCDSPAPEDVAYTNRQIESFGAVLDELGRRGATLPKRHIQCSYGIINYPAAHADYARPGLAVYGIADESRCIGPAPKLVPIFEVKARIALVKHVYAGERVGYGGACVAQKDGRVAVMTMGYADGLPRGLSNGAGKVLLHGQQAPIVGSVCMDQALLDVSHINDVKPGDVAVIIGQSGGRRIDVCEFAAAAGTIPNEITSRFGVRLAREYF